MKIEVTRAFFWEGKAQPVGTVLEVSKLQARELAAANKARPAGEIPATPAGPLTSENASELVAGKGTKR